MTQPRLFNVYCDESCHLEHDGVPVMAWGAVHCLADPSRAISEAVRTLKAEHGLAHDFEAKWTKVSPAKADFYLALIDLFLNDERLRFRGLVVPDKGLLDHARFAPVTRRLVLQDVFHYAAPNLLRAASVSHLPGRQGNTRRAENPEAP